MRLINILRLVPYIRFLWHVWSQPFFCVILSLAKNYRWCTNSQHNNEIKAQQRKQSICTYRKCPLILYSEVTNQMHLTVRISTPPTTIKVSPFWMKTVSPWLCYGSPHCCFFIKDVSIFFHELRWNIFLLKYMISMFWFISM